MNPEYQSLWSYADSLPEGPEKSEALKAIAQMEQMEKWEAAQRVTWLRTV